MTTKQLSWTPTRRGRSYCSPACGGGCTWSEFSEATRAGQRLTDVMNSGGGSGWTPNVWENPGWHYEVIKADDTCVVHASPGILLRDRIYWSEINVGGFQFRSDHHKNPHLAFAQARGAALELMNAIRSKLERI